MTPSLLTLESNLHKGRPGVKEWKEANPEASVLYWSRTNVQSGLRVNSMVWSGLLLTIRSYTHSGETQKSTQVSPPPYMLTGLLYVFFAEMDSVLHEILKSTVELLSFVCWTRECPVEIPCSVHVNTLLWVPDHWLSQTFIIYHSSFSSRKQ